MHAAKRPAAHALRGWTLGRAALLTALASMAGGQAAALDYRTTIEPATILYDGPSQKSQRLFVVGRDYPFEVVVTVEGWVKVRDIAGAPLFWVEKKALGEKRVVVVKVLVADVLAAADAGAKVVFRAEQNVLLELVEQPTTNWARVRHRDGQTGFVSISQIWGL